MTEYSHLTIDQLVDGINETGEKLSAHARALKVLASQPLDPAVRQKYTEALAKTRAQVETDLDDLRTALELVKG